MGAASGCCAMAAHKMDKDLLEDSIPIIESDTKSEIEEIVKSLKEETSPLLAVEGEGFPKATDIESSASFGEEDVREAVPVARESILKESDYSWVDEESQDEGGIAGEMDSPDDG